MWRVTYCETKPGPDVFILTIIATRSKDMIEVVGLKRDISRSKEAKEQEAPAKEPCSENI